MRSKYFAGNSLVFHSVTFNFEIISISLKISEDNNIPNSYIDVLNIDSSVI